MRRLEHATAFILGLAVLLEVIAIGSSNVGLYLGGASTGLVGALGAGIAWLAPVQKRDIFKILLVGLSVAYLLWILLLPISRVAMLVLSWLTCVLVAGSFWLVHANSRLCLYGMLLCYLLVQIGYTVFGAGSSVGGAIAAIVIGSVGFVGFFYYDRWMLSPGRSAANFDSKIVIVEDGTPAVAVGFVDYGASTVN